MKTFIKVIKKLYWLGLLGFVGSFLDIPSLDEYFGATEPC